MVLMINAVTRLTESLLSADDKQNKKCRLIRRET